MSYHLKYGGFQAFLFFHMSNIKEDAIRMTAPSYFYISFFYLSYLFRFETCRCCLITSYVIHSRFQISSAAPLTS